VRPVHDGCEHDGRLGVRRDWQHIYARNRSGRALGALSVAPGDDLPGPRCQSCLRGLTRHWVTACKLRVQEMVLGGICGLRG
jgi:hypothetical protein